MTFSWYPLRCVANAFGAVATAGRAAERTARLVDAEPSREAVANPCLRRVIAGDRKTNVKWVWIKR